MNDRPGGKVVTCPQCGDIAYAIVPRDSVITDEEERADGKVWGNCHECGERFLVYYQT